MPGKVNVRRNVQGANCPGVEMSGRIVWWGKICGGTVQGKRLQGNVPISMQVYVQNCVTLINTDTTASDRYYYDTD